MIKSRRMIWVGYVAGMERILVGKPEGKRVPQRRRRRRWADNIKIDLREIRRGVIWTGSFWLRIATSGGLL
jgi:hypothetical protein